MKLQAQILLVGSLLLALAGCDKTTEPVAGGSDETHSGIAITGAIYTDRNTPYAGMVVRLRHLGLSDTTDSRGTYRLVKTDTVVAATGGAVDTLDIWREGRVVHSQAVKAWIDTLPDVFLTQRNISGKLVGEVLAVKSVVALFGTSRTDTLELEWNPVLGSYSGFSYFPWDGSVIHYQMRIEVRDSLHRLIGRSVDIPFTSRAGDLDIPTFPAGNARPTLRLVGPDTATSRTLLVLHAVALDSFGQNVKVKWREIPDTGILSPVTNQLTFKLQKSTDTMVRYYVPSGSDSLLVFHCTATDEDGLSVQDSLVVRRNPSPPSISLNTHVAGDSVRVWMSASDVNGGKIAQYRLFLGYQQVSWWIADFLCVDDRTTTLDSGWGSSRDTPLASTTSCGSRDAASGIRTSFIKRDTGILVSGRDTTFAIPAVDSLGRVPQFGLRVVDGDGEVSIRVSNTFHKLPGPDSVTWTISPLDSAQGTGYRMDVHFKPVNDSSQNPLARVALVPEGWDGTLRLNGAAYDLASSWSRFGNSTESPVLSFTIPGPEFFGCLSITQDFQGDVSVPTTVCRVAGPKTP